MHLRHFVIAFHLLVSSSYAGKALVITQGPELSPYVDRKLKPYKDFISHTHFFLRPLFPNDAKALEPIFTDPKAMFYLGYKKPCTQEGAQELIPNPIFKYT